jgi:hypothetical protein
MRLPVGRLAVVSRCRNDDHVTTPHSFSASSLSEIPDRLDPAHRVFRNVRVERCDLLRYRPAKLGSRGSA